MTLVTQGHLGCGLDNIFFYLDLVYLLYRACWCYFENSLKGKNQISTLKWETLDF